MTCIVLVVVELLVHVASLVGHVATKPVVNLERFISVRVATKPVVNLE